MSVRHSKIAAFTLVELLVVIGIIAVLIAILLPSLNKARDAANRTACLSNVRQLSVFAIMYANENRGRFPLENVSTFGNTAPDTFRMDMYDAMKMPPFNPAAVTYTEVDGARYWTCPVAPAFLYNLGSPYFVGGNPYISTSYMYLGSGGGNALAFGSDEAIPGRRPERFGQKQPGNAPRTLFADRVMYFNDFRAWQVNHMGKGGATGVSAFVAGGNQSFTDGHAEWVPARTSPATVIDYPGYPTPLRPGFTPLGNANLKHVATLPDGYASYWW